MTKQILLLVFSCFLTLSWAGDTLVSYSGYSFRIPKEFKKVGKQKRAAVQAKHPQWKGLVVYEEQGTQHPKWLVFSTDSLRQVSQRTFEERTLELTDALFVNGITHDTLHYDTNLGCIYGPFIENGDTSLYGFVFTDFGVIKLLLDHPAGKTLDDKQLIESIMTSLEKTIPIECTPSQQARIIVAKREMDLSRIRLIFAFCIMIFIWLMRKIVRNR
jgi:hypothetical protein